MPHKRTFYYLEQLILKHKYDQDVLKVRPLAAPRLLDWTGGQVQAVPDGLDFFFAHRSHGNKLIEFLSNWSPIKKAESKELVSQVT